MDIKNVEDFNNIIRSSPTVLVDFFATWCIPCKKQSVILDQARNDIKEEKIVKVDIEELEDLVEDLQIRSVPTLILFKDGKEVWRESRVLSKSEILNKLGVS